MNLLLFILLLAQSTPEALIEELGQADIQVRTRAARELLERGAAAAPALMRATKHADLEVALQARELLTRIETRDQLTPTLRALSGLEVRLSHGGDAAWTVFLLEALPWRADPGSPYSALGRADLDSLIAKAIAGAKDEPQLLEVLGTAQQYRLGSAKALSASLVADARPAVRVAAARTLMLSAGKDAVKLAPEVLANKDDAVRIGVIGALADGGVHDAVPLLEGMRGEKALAMPLGCALLRLESKVGEALLAERAERNSQATMYLSFYGGPAVIPQMRAQLRWLKEDPNVAYGALNHLGCWGDRASIPAIEDAVRELKLEGNCPNAAAKALYYMGATGSTATLLKLAEEGSGQALNVLGLMGQHDAAPGLRTLLAKGRLDAAGALAEMGDQESIPAIRMLLTHEDESHRQAACSALASLKDVASLEKLRTMPEAAQARRLWALLQMATDVDGAALPPKVVRNPGYRVSEYAAALSEGTNSSHGFPRYLSVRAAATVRAGRTVADLRPWLGRQDDEYTGQIAAAALARLGLKDGIPELIDASRLIMSMNAVRMPSTWAKLESQTTKLDLYAPYEQLHRALAGDVGLPLEGPPKDSSAYKAWVDVHQRFRKQGRPPTVAEAFEILEDDRWAIVLEVDRIRVVPRETARQLWLEWMKTNEK